MKRGPISKPPPPDGTFVNADTRVLELLASKEGFLLLRKGLLGPRCLRTPKSVCLCCSRGGGRPICTPAFLDGEHQSLTLGRKEKCIEVWLHLYFPCDLGQGLEHTEPFSAGAVMNW